MSYTTAALPRRYLLGTSLLSQQPIELAEASGERQKHGLLLVTEFHVLYVFVVLAAWCQLL